MPVYPRPFLLILNVFSLALCIGPYGVPLVQADKTAVPTLDPVIVTGSAHPTQLHRSTQSHTIVAHHDYAPLQPNRLSSILQQVPGIHLDEMGSRGGISSIYLRGADPNFTLIMLNGIPLNDSTDQRGGSIDISTIPIDQITRVEIVRGPLSALYGSEAMAGAINLVTDSHTDNPKGHVLLEGGRFDSRKGLIQGQGELGPLSANLSLSHTSNEEQVKNDAFSQHAVGWNLGMEPGSYWDIRLTGQFAHSSVRSFPEGSGGPTFALLRETEKRETQAFLTGLTIALENPTEWHHQIFLSLSKRSQDVNNPGVLSSPSLFAIPPTRFTTDYHRYQGRLTETWIISPYWTFSFGGQVTHERGNRDGTQDLSSFGGRPDEPVNFSLDRTYGGSFVELTATTWETFTLNTGARLDLAEQTQPRMSPRVSARYHLLPLLHLRGAYGKGFKLPGLASLGDPLFGNPSLKPETSTGWDLGMELHTPHHELTASVTYFHHRYRGLIDLDPDLLTQGMFQLTNLDSAITKGWEWSLKLSPKAPVAFQANLTYLTTRVTKTGDALRNRPKWRGGLGLTVQVSPTISLSNRVTFLSSRPDFQIPTQTTRVGGYIKADATLSYRPVPNWRWYAALENFTNASYEEFRGFPATPLIFRLGIEYLYSPTK
jgi:outer membrane cobalamin receptor